MKVILVGLAADVAAIVAYQWFLAARYAPPPVRELGTLQAWASLDDLGKQLVPATQPDRA